MPLCVEPTGRVACNRNVSSCAAWSWPRTLLAAWSTLGMPVVAFQLLPSYCGSLKIAFSTCCTGMAICVSVSLVMSERYTWSPF